MYGGTDYNNPCYCGSLSSDIPTYITLRKNIHHILNPSKSGWLIYGRCAIRLFKLYSTYYHKKSRQTVIAHSFIGSASKASGSLMILICKFLTSINVSCLHFGQKRGYFFNSVSSRILVRVLPPHIGHTIHFSFFIILNT